MESTDATTISIALGCHPGLRKRHPELVSGSIMNYYVYIVSNYKRTTFYIGVTNNLSRRMFEHRNGLIDGFTKKYNLKFLLYFEETNDIKAAIAREKQLKNWHRDWKINLIKQMNPELRDLDAETSSA